MRTLFSRRFNARINPHSINWRFESVQSWNPEEREQERECHLKRNTSTRFTCRLPLEYRADLSMDKKLRQYAGLKSGFNFNWFELIILLSTDRPPNSRGSLRVCAVSNRVFPLAIFPLLPFSPFSFFASRH